jgi:hypothetical protein
MTEYSELSAAFSDKTVSKEDAMKGIVGTIIDNLKVQLTNLHIRIEQKIGDRLIAIGVVLPRIRVYTIDDSGKEIFVSNSAPVVKKKLVIEGLSIYLDPRATPIDENAFQQQMLAGMQDEHDYILRGFALEAIWEHPKTETATFANRISVTLNAINLAFNACQSRSLQEMQQQKRLFDLRRFYAPCLKPEEVPESPAGVQSWWGFAHRSGYKKLHPIAFTVRHAVTFLKNRSAELKTLKQILLKPNPKKDPAVLNKMKAKWGDEVYLLFRAYAWFATERDLRREAKGLELAAKDIQELAKLNAERPQNASDLTIVNFDITYLEFVISLGPDMPITTANFQLIAGEVRKTDAQLSIAAGLKVIRVINSRKKDVFQMIPSKSQSDCASFQFSQVQNSNAKKIVFTCTSPKIIADVGLLRDFEQFASGQTAAAVGAVAVAAPRVAPRDSTRAEIEYLVQNHTVLDLSVRLESPVITVPTAVPIVLSLGTLIVRSEAAETLPDAGDLSTCYDHFQVLLQGINLTTENQLICEPFDVSLAAAHSFVRQLKMGMTKVAFRLSAIAVHVTRTQYLRLLSISALFAERPPAPDPKPAVEVSPPSMWQFGRTLLSGEWQPKTGPYVGSQKMANCFRSAFSANLFAGMLCGFVNVNTKLVKLSSHFRQLFVSSFFPFHWRDSHSSGV